MQDSYMARAESMVHANKNSANRYFNVEKQAAHAFVKASNVLLEPFCMSKRGQDTRAQKHIRMPANPIGV